MSPFRPHGTKKLFGHGYFMFLIKLIFQNFYSLKLHDLKESNYIEHSFTKSSIISSLQLRPVFIFWKPRQLFSPETKWPNVTMLERESRFWSLNRLKSCELLSTNKYFLSQVSCETSSLESFFLFKTHEAQYCCRAPAHDLVVFCNLLTI